MGLQCIPEDAFVILEFDKIRERIHAACVGPGAASLARHVMPETNLPWIRRELTLAHEAQRLIERGMVLLPHGYGELTAVYRTLPIANYVLEIDQILMIWQLMDLAESLRTLFDAEREEAYPGLAGVVHRLHPPGPVLKAITRVMDEQGQILPNASRALEKISQEIQAVSRQCDAVFQKLVRQYVAQDRLADTHESVRNERRVLAVKAEYKRQIRGIIHDQSASGRTAFIEPEEVIAINNDLFDLRAAFKAEVQRLLLALCDTLREHLVEIKANEACIIELDLHQAKGRLCRSLNAHVPVVEDTPRLSFRRAFHPLLLLRNLHTGRPTIPFELDLHHPNRILLLSGPNAGGKSALLKAVGLLQLMVQSGIPVPVSPDSEFGIFHQISASLGDHQSLENDLSTYSSKLAEMRACLESAGERSLVLIDEFGSGTDPRLGGAIAEGILEALRVRGVYGVITTHYSELKVYAYRKHGVVNGAMVFDKERMVPTYELRIGKPGSSYTFEIAGQSGLPEEVLAYAGKKTGGMQLRAMEDLLSDLEAQKSRLETELRQAEKRSAQLDQLVQSYERMQSDLTAQRQRLRLEQKEKEYAHLSQMNRDLEKTIREIRAEKDAEAAKKQLEEVKEVREQARTQIGRISGELKAKKQQGQRPFRPGDPVRVHNGTQTGTITEVRKGIASVNMGILRLEIPVDELVHAGDPLDIRSSPSIQTHTEVPDRFDPKLDLRGMRPAEAEALLERFMDMALMANVAFVEIVHGKGTGALRKMVMQKLREYPVREVSQPEDASGGSGHTVVSF